MNSEGFLVDSVFIEYSEDGDFRYAVARYIVPLVVSGSGFWSSGVNIEPSSTLQRGWYCPGNGVGE